MKHVTERIILRACQAKLELKEGPLASHVGCAFEVQYPAGREDDDPVPREDVRAELTALGFVW